jgi:hypothetical protein
VTIDPIVTGLQLEGKQLFHLFAEKAKPAARDAAGCNESLVKLRRQALRECTASDWADVDAIALEPLIAHAVAFLDSDLNARLL